MSMDAPVLISVRGVTKHFALKRARIFGPREVVHALDDVSFDVMPGETLAIVGESGCGKSTIARTIMGITDPDAGTISEILYEPGESRTLRRVQMVFQDSYLSLNPRLPVIESVAFGPIANGVPKPEAHGIASQLLSAVQLDAERIAWRYPHQLSGGQRQRVNIARALALRPQLLILDEAVSALDKSIQAQVLNLLADLKEQYSFTYLFISHDLNVVRYISDRVLVMYLGHVVEIGTANDIYDTPRHPYTVALLGAAPSFDPRKRTHAATLQGDPPSPISPPSGCRFRTRCAFAENVCATARPRLERVSGPREQAVSCHMYIPGSGHSQQRA
jgi:peptide/nickel transport system ATP-binding protein